MPNTPRTPLNVRLDNKTAFNSLKGTRYYEDAVYEKFSSEEMARRYTAVRVKMARLGVDALIVSGGPSHWSFGGGMRWLTGHVEWHAMLVYVLVPMAGEPMLVYKALIFDVIVKPNYRGTGLGKDIINHILAMPELSDVKSFELYCPDRISGFYQKLGFEVSASKLHYKHL